MRQINYDKLRQVLKPKGSIDEEANRIANHLIRELSIPTGVSLSKFLEVDCCFDNHMAIRVWVQKRLVDLGEVTFEEKCQHLQSKLYDRLPA